MLDGNPLTGLIEPPDRKDSWRWGTIMSHNPVRVLLDGDSEPSLATPDTLIPVLTGDRVRVQIANRRMTITGRTENPTDKRALSLIAGWTPYEGGHAIPTVRRDLSGRISLSGLCRTGTMERDTYFSLVPAAWAPGSRHIYQVRVGTGAGRVDVNADGRINFMEGTGGFVSLDGISWYPGE